MDRYLCIHCHFYQPPRENPWLESIELQDSAYPYHDWNERITAECYAANASSRILTGDNRITRIVNNYSRISFNFGPTLLSWMEEHAPDTYQAILDCRQGEPAALLGTRQRHRAGLQPHDHAAGQPARQADPGDLGHSRLRAPLRPQARRHVAGRDRRRYRDPRSAGRAWHPVHRAGAVAGQARAPHRDHEVQERRRRQDRSHARLHLQSALGAQHQPVLLRRPHLARASRSKVC